MIMEKRNITMQIKEMVNFIMYVLVEFVFSDSYMYFDLNLNASIVSHVTCWFVSKCNLSIIFILKNNNQIKQC
jgi:uncharacterized membrane protein (GlpM family)